MAGALSEVYGDPLPPNIPSLWESFSSAAERYPDNIALVATHQPPNLFGITNQPLEDEQYSKKPYLRWTYKEFKNAIERTKRGLQTLGVHEEMPILTFVNNGAEYFLVLQAANSIGAVLAPLNPKNLANKEEITHMIKVVLSSCPGQQAVIIVQDENIAKQIDALPISEGAIKIILQHETGISPSKPESWVPFEEVMAVSKESSITNGHVVNPSQDQTIFFTSGTTSLPKGVRMPVGRTSSFLESRGFRRDVDAGDRWCVVVPNNHVMAYVVTNASFSAGAAVVLAGSAFVPTIMIDTLFRERCTHATLVPTMLHALIGIKAAQGQKLNHLKHVIFGGSLLTPAVLKSCVEELGANAVENAYGMTEGTIISTGRQTDPMAMVKGDDVSVGSVLTGTGIKCCLPNEVTPVSRGKPGEIHFHSESLGYANYIGTDSDDFYNDTEGRRWFKTGDQGVIDHDGRIFLVGRYKDMIIRGGENISPAAVESAIALMPQMKGVLVQVIAAPDDIAGEVPVAVIQGEVTPELAQGVQDAVIKAMGTTYVPDEVISLSQLGLVDYPRTMAGKIQKTKLAALVRKYRSEQDAVMTNGTDSQLEREVKSIWAKAVGIPLANLRIDDPLSEIADSITVMRVRDKIKRQTGKTLSLTEMAESGTIAGQIKLLKSQPVADTKETTHHRVVRQGPPGVEDMAHLTEDPELFEPTKEVISKALAAHGLEWDDVEDVMPAYDFANVMAEMGDFDSWGFKMALMPSNVNKKQLRTAIETMLKNNRILASFLVWDRKSLESDLALHVAIRQDKKLFDIVIQDEGTVETVEELGAIPLKYPYPQHALFPGPLFRALIYYVEETKSAAVITNVSHAAIDASYAQIYSEDFDRALTGSTNLHEHLDYKIWADSYYSLRTSPEARAGTKWHLTRLKTIASHKKALWPPTPNRSKYDPTVQETEDGYQTSFEAPKIPLLRKANPNLTAVIILKAALALLNIHRTGHTHALFANLEAARTSFPFLPKSLQDTGKWEATDVAGPTISSAINLIPITNPSETVLDFLARMQEDQKNLTKYASTPWREIMSSLSLSNKDTGDLIPQVTTTQIFNWVPGFGTTGTDPYANFRLVNAVVRPLIGLAVNAGLGGEKGCTVFLHLRGDAMGVGELRRFAGELERIVLWVCEGANWGRKVGEFGESLG